MRGWDWKWIVGLLVSLVALGFTAGPIINGNKKSSCKSLEELVSQCNLANRQALAAENSVVTASLEMSHDENYTKALDDLRVAVQGVQRLDGEAERVFGHRGTEGKKVREQYGKVVSAAVDFQNFAAIGRKQKLTFENINELQAEVDSFERLVNQMMTSTGCGG